MLVTILGSLLNGTTLYAFYSWAVGKEYLKDNNKAKIVTENSVGSFLRRYTPTNLMGSFQYSIPKEKYVTFTIRKKSNISESSECLCLYK